MTTVHLPPTTRAAAWFSDNSVKAASAVVGLVAWEVGGRTIDHVAAQPLSRVIEAWLLLWRDGSLQAGLSVSTPAWGLGFALAMAVGVVLGIAMGLFREVDRLLGPYVNALLALPSVAYIPIIMLWFGFGFTSRVVVVFEFSVFVIALNARAGVRSVDRELVEMARSFSLGKGALYRRIVFPSALPEIFAGLRLGLGRSVKGIVTAEVLMTLVGLGGMIAYHGGGFRIHFLLAIVGTIVVLSVSLTSVLHRLDARFNDWKLARH